MRVCDAPLQACCLPGCASVQPCFTCALWCATANVLLAAFGYGKTPARLCVAEDRGSVLPQSGCRFCVADDRVLCYLGPMPIPPRVLATLLGGLFVRASPCSAALCISGCRFSFESPPNVTPHAGDCPFQ